ncbi:MAG: YCF48-related protein [Bacteroidota bacterium]
MKAICHLPFTFWLLLSSSFFFLCCAGEGCTPEEECEIRICLNDGTPGVVFVGQFETKCVCQCVGHWTSEPDRDDCGKCGLTEESCENGGTLDRNFCKCACPPGFSGEFCETALVQAQAGEDRTVNIGDLIALDGSASEVPSSQSLGVEWELTSKPALSQATIMSETLIPDEPGSYTVRLKAFAVEDPSTFAYDEMIVSIHPATIDQIEPLETYADSVITIHGSNFSNQVNGGMVWFEQASSGAEILRATDQELEVRVPRDAMSGIIRLHLVETGQDVLSSESLEILGQWEPVFSSNSLFSEMAFGDQQTGIAIGSGGLIVRTHDGGKSWNSSPSGTTNFLTGVDFATPDIVYVTGEKGTLLKSVNGGLDWTSIDVGTGVHLRGVSFPNADTGYVTGDQGKVVSSFDGGITWNQKSLGGSLTFTNAAFQTGFRGAVIGENARIMRTTNAGVNFALTSIPAASSGFLRTLFQGGNMWIAVGEKNVNEGLILRSTDSGESFEKIPSGVDQHLWGVGFYGQNDGMIVGSNGTILHTEDGGVSWIERPANPTEDLLSVFMKGPQEAVLLGKQSIYLNHD